MNALPTIPPMGTPEPAARPCSTVLVVDDYPAICDLIARHLAETGYRVLATSDPLEAMRMLLSENGCVIDLVLTDVEMPKMRGEELASWCAKVRPQARVLLMSTNSECLTGTVADGFIQKPFSLARLSGAVRDALAARAADQAELSSAA